MATQEEGCEPSLGSLIQIPTGRESLLQSLQSISAMRADNLGKSIKQHTFLWRGLLSTTATPVAQPTGRRNLTPLVIPLWQNPVRATDIGITNDASSFVQESLPIGYFQNQLEAYKDLPTRKKCTREKGQEFSYWVRFLARQCARTCYLPSPFVSIIKRQC